MPVTQRASQADVSPQDDPETSSRPTPTSTHATPWPTSSTPQRGRETTRYPDSLGRVPLHRRGTSKTYERLEDLLREAGYKETRVFTPETDRIAPPTAAEKDGTGSAVRASVGAVVDFIAGLVSRGSSLSHEAAPAEDSAHAWSQPPSPLAHAIHIKNHRAKRVPSKTSLSRTGSSESVRRRIHVDLAAGAPEQAPTHHPSSQGPPHHPRSYHKAHHHHRDQFSNRHHHRLHDYSSKSTTAKGNPPNARAYLRHMASAPNIQPLPERPSVSEASLRSHALGRARRQAARPTFILNDQDNIVKSDCEPHARDRGHQVHPPLPRNWMESVAKALLSGAGVAAPGVVSDAASTKTGSTRKSSALSDKSNQGERGRSATKPPLLCMQVREVKAQTSEGQVVRTRVMCRSTPTSRASSRVRNSHEDHASARYGGKRKDGGAARHGKRAKNRDADVVPSLARTKAENDGWMAPRRRYVSGWGVEGSVQPDGTWSDGSDHDDHDDHDDEDDDDDEEGELGLDRLLVPARRQHSIQSLRKHLQRPGSQAFGGRGAPGTRSPRSENASPFGGATADGIEWGTTSWSTSQSREWLPGCEEDEDGYGRVSSASKWRRGLPGLGQWTTSQGS